MNKEAYFRLVAEYGLHPSAVPPEPLIGQGLVIPYSQHGKRSEFRVLSISPTYISGLSLLVEACSQDPQSEQPLLKGIARPFTLKESVQARVDTYGSSTPEERRNGATLHNLLLSSCTGIATKAQSTKFKIVPIAKELVRVHLDYPRATSFIPINYDEIYAEEFDTAQLSFLSTKEKARQEPSWLSALEGDKNLLETYVDQLFADPGCRPEKMGFWVADNKRQDELRPLLLYCWYDGLSCAIAGSLAVKGCFVRKRLSPGHE